MGNDSLVNRGISRRRFASALLLGLSFTWALPSFAESQELFRLERSTNRNAVRYDVRTLPSGALDPHEPVTAYWLLLAEDGRREGLTWLERSMAYGFHVSQASAGVDLRLVAFDRRIVHVRRKGDRFRAEVAIAGKEAVLRRIWVQVEGSLLGPKVRFIDLFGVDPQTGKSVVERIVNR
jgi:hypothetical protein